MNGGVASARIRMGAAEDVDVQFNLLADTDAAAVPPAPISPTPALSPARSGGIWAEIERHFYRLRWHIPGARMGGNPRATRLLAVPADTVPADATRGHAIRSGRFHFAGIDVPTDSADFKKLALPDAYIRYIHRFDWARDLHAALVLGEARPYAEAIAERWLRALEKPSGHAGWMADTTAWRMLNIAAYAPALLASLDTDYRAQMLGHVANCADYLDRFADKARRGRPRLIAWIGVVAAGLLLPKGKARQINGEIGLTRALADCVLPDGGVASRAPASLIEVIQALSLLKNCYAAVGKEPPAMVSDALTKCVPALMTLTHGDGGLGAWQGSAAMPPETVRAAIAGSGLRPRAAANTREWGFQRMTAGRSTLIFDGGPPPAEDRSIAGCASTLALEFSHAHDRIFVNCGGAALVGAHISADLSRALRTTAAHSTLCLADTNSTAIERGGQMGLGVEEVTCTRRVTDQGLRLEGSHNGYDRNFGFTHKRLIVMSEDGLQLRGMDTLLPGGAARIKGSEPVAIRFHLPPDVEATVRPDRQSAVLRTGSGAVWLFHATDGKMRVEDSLWVDPTGIPRASWQLVIDGEVGAGGMSSGWLLRFGG